MPESDTSELEVVRVGDRHYLKDHWVAAFNQVGLSIILQRMEHSSSVRQDMRAVRGARTKEYARRVVKAAAKLIRRSGEPVEFGPGMVEVAAFPG